MKKKEFQAKNHRQKHKQTILKEKAVINIGNNRTLISKTKED